MARPVKVLSGFVVVLAASVAFGQPPGGQGGGFGRGFGGPQPAVSLLAMSEVRTELDTDDEQNAKIEDLGDDLRENMRDAFGDFQALQDLSDEERAKRMAEGRTKAEALGQEADAKLAEILKPEQVERLNQLRLQREGVMSLARPEVAEMLGLTTDQRDKAREILEAGRPEPRNLRDASDEERREWFAEMRERREKTQADLLALLTDEQKTKWTEAQGEKFEFPERGGPGGARRQ